MVSRAVVSVTAILVAHDGATWLPRTLAAVAAQTRRPDRVIGVDTGSTDASPRLLAGALGPRQVVTAGRRTGFGDAVRAGLAHAGASPDSLDVSHAATPGAPGSGDWIWLLHDDGAPEPDALARLLDAVRRSPSIGIAGPKLVAWDDRTRLLEVGLTVSRGGRRITDVEPGERDQGQHDHRQDVLAVGTAGMLVRRDVWDRLGGLAPALPLFRDDIDLGWRAQLAGHRVVVVPSAVVADAQAGARGMRPVDAVRGAPRRIDRAHGLRVALAEAPSLALPFLLLWFAVGGVLRVLGLLATKAPSRAYDELIGVAAAVLTPWRALAIRWRSRGTRQVPRRDIARLLAPRRTALRGVSETFSGGLAGGLAHVHVVGGRPVETGPGSEETDQADRVTSRMTQRILTHPGVWAVLIAAVVAGLSARRLIGHGDLAGGQLLPWTGDPTQIWHTYTDAWHGSGLGTAGTSSPYLAVLAGIAWVLHPFAADSAARTVDLLVLGSMPLSALTAYIASRSVLRSRLPRAWAALAWATLPTVTVAMAGGRLGASVAHIMLPLAAAGIGRTLRRPGSSTAAFAGGLALAIAGAFVPVVLLVGAAAALIALVLGGWSRRARALLLLAVPAVLLAPWLPALYDAPRLLVAGPGLLGPAAGGAAPLHVALLHPAGLAAPYWWVGAPLVVAGLAGLLRKGGSWLLASCGLLALTGLALALALPRVVVGSGTAVSASVGVSGPLAGWEGTGIDLMALGLLLAALHGVDGIRTRLSRYRFGWRQLILAPLAALTVASTLAVGLLAILHPVTGPVHRTTSVALPAVAVDQAGSPAATRSLVLTPGRTGIGYRLVGVEPGLPALDLPLPAGRSGPARLTQSVIDSSGDVSAQSTAQALARYAVGFVIVARPVPAALEQRLDTTPGLTQLGQGGTWALWRVELGATASGSTKAASSAATGSSSGAGQPVARAGIVSRSGTQLTALPVSGPNGRVDTTIAAGPTGRRVALAEPSDAVWRATLNGVPLAPVSSSGLQQFRLPAAGGHLRISAAGGGHRLRDLQGVGLLVVLLLALPLGRRRGPDPIFGAGPAARAPRPTPVASVPSTDPEPVVATPDSAAAAEPDAAEMAPDHKREPDHKMEPDQEPAPDQEPELAESTEAPVVDEPADTVEADEPADEPAGTPAETPAGESVDEREVEA